MKIYSKIEEDTLLHLVTRLSEVESVEMEYPKLARVDIAPENQFLQVAILRMDTGRTFRPHKHIFKEGPEKVIAQESWVVIKGRVKVFFYDLDDTIIQEEVLEAGDFSMTFRGGHNYEALEDDTQVYEYKTGPYLGVEKDKEFVSN